MILVGDLSCLNERLEFSWNGSGICSLMIAKFLHIFTNVILCSFELHFPRAFSKFSSDFHH